MRANRQEYIAAMNTKHIWWKLCLITTQFWIYVIIVETTNRRDIFLEDSEAKSILRGMPSRRVKRFLGDAIHGIFHGEENLEMAKQSMEFNNEVVDMYKAISCKSSCLGQWGQWSLCSEPCQSGRRTRTRPTVTSDTCSSYPCPGVRLHTQTCTKNCGKGGRIDSSGNCQCHAGYSGDCCQHRASCSKPRALRNGHIRGVLVWPAFYGEGFINQCNEGFALIGGPEVRVCQENGEWSDTDPTCQRIRCEELPAPDHGLVTTPAKDEYVFGNTMGFECELGYDLRGSSFRNCDVNEDGSSFWNGFETTCTERVCGDPGTPAHGQHDGLSANDQYPYGTTLTFTCDGGTRLIGSSRLTCLHTARWNGTHPICQRVLCPAVEAPEHGNVVMATIAHGNNVGGVLEFTCNHGYELYGATTMQCLSDGNWNATVPTCRAIECPDPGSLEHGSRDDRGFRLGQLVHWVCFAGYILEGFPQATCQAGGSWSAPPPLCHACPLHHYTMEMTSGERLCVRCPPDSHTLTVASSSKQQCLCDRGYSGPHGGPCTAMECPVLAGVPHGRLHPCSTSLGSECVYQCEAGYIITAGSSVRRCREPGVWDGSSPTCTACPMDTFRGGKATCLPCPVFSHTADIGSVLENCTCDAGFTGPQGGPCHDVDECEAGTSGCQQACRNTLGSYLCECNIPGYVLEVDRLTCFPDRVCKNLTADDAPGNGGLACHWFREENSQQCSIRCNPGYDIPDRVNSYETCGPTTGFKWSYKRVNASAELFPCIPEFYPDFHFEVDSTYFVQTCSSLSEEQKKAVGRQFAQQLSREGVCWRRRSRICHPKDVGIICGHSQRKRRDADNSTDIDDSSTDIADLKFGIHAIKVNDKTLDCPQICRMLRLPRRHCPRFCIPAYKRYLRAAVQHAQTQIRALYADPEKRRATFEVLDRRFVPTGSVHVGAVRINCEEGMEATDELCVPCAAGNYLSESSGTCVPCRIGWYQAEQKQTTCERCPMGTYTPFNGSTTCQPCPVGLFGMDCASTCDCEHGQCLPVDGSCVCAAGWTGLSCDADVNGCQDSACFPGVTCQDVSAPGTGFVCGACPADHFGDGAYCLANTMDQGD